MIPWEDGLQDCALCGEPYLINHFIHHCGVLHDVKTRWLGILVWGIGIEGITVAGEFSIGKLSLCHAGATCSIGNLLVICHVVEGVVFFSLR